jgi:NAD(P)H-flavin reductase
MIDQAPDPMMPRPFSIQRTRRETEDTFTVELVPTDGTGGHPFTPGQFNMLYLFGVGEIPISISGDPNESMKLVHTTRAVGPVTKAMQKLKRGSSLGVRGPYGTGWPLEQMAGSDVVLVAGGIGLAPLRPALFQLISQRERYGRIVLLYGARTPADILFPKDLEHWRARFDLEVYVTVDRAMASWRGNVGVVTSLIPKAPFDPSQTHALVCGPEVMMRFAAHELVRRGVNSSDVYLSMERNMKCAVGFCGHCQFGPYYVCKDGPVFRYDRVRDLMWIREV